VTRAINDKIDALFVEGPDDGAVVNAFIKRRLGIDLAKHPSKLVRADDAGGGDAWVLSKFAEVTAAAPPAARVGAIVDRDGPSNDKWPKVRALLAQLAGSDGAPPYGDDAIFRGRFGIWMWPDNLQHGDLETFVADIVPASATLAYASEATLVAKQVHGAEYEIPHHRKAALKVRSVWRDASAAGGYGHLIRNLEIVSTPASEAFLGWFTTLFLT